MTNAQHPPIPGLRNLGSLPRILLCVLSAHLLHADQFVTPSGAGTRSGADWANARPGDELAAALEAAGAPATVWVGSGFYTNLTVRWRIGGGGPAAIKSLVGHDTGGGLPVFVSNFDRRSPHNTGSTFLTLEPGVSHVRIAQLRLEGHATAIRLLGRHRVVRVDDIEVTNSRDAFWIEGGAVAGLPDTGSTDLELRSCRVIRFTKRGFRVLGGNSQVRFIDCHADAGGKDWAAETFPIGFHVLGGEQGVTDRDITFTDCSASGAWHDAGTRYWNGDGFATEGATRNLTWIRCRASDNTDGGWDLKTSGAKLVDCVSLRNKRNYRFWPSGTPVRLENCLSAYSLEHRTGKPGQGAWIKATTEVQMDRCTFWHDGTAIAVEDGSEIEPTVLRLGKCLVRPAEAGRAFDFCPGVRCASTGSLLPDNTATEVRLVEPAPAWRGGNNAFDSVSHPDWGYRFLPAPTGSPDRRTRDPERAIPTPATLHQP